MVEHSLTMKAVAPGAGLGMCPCGWRSRVSDDGTMCQPGHYSSDDIRRDYAAHLTAVSERGMPTRDEQRRLVNDALARMNAVAARWLDTPEVRDALLRRERPEFPHGAMWGVGEARADGRTEGEVLALHCVGELQKLLTNVRSWVANGQSETAVRAMNDATADGWEAVGWAAWCRMEKERVRARVYASGPEAIRAYEQWGIASAFPVVK